MAGGTPRIRHSKSALSRKSRGACNRLADSRCVAGAHGAPRDSPAQMRDGLSFRSKGVPDRSDFEHEGRPTDISMIPNLDFPGREVIIRSLIEHPCGTFLSEVLSWVSKTCVSAI